jgi:plastocyanin
VVGAALVFTVPSGAVPRTARVYVQFAAYGPSQLDVLPGQTVRWTNVSQRTHTVTSDEGLFDSGDVPGGAGFSFTFNTVGTYRYHCTIHAGITGEIDVRRLTLESLPPAAVPVGTRVEFAGMTAHAGRPVVVEEQVGTKYVQVGSARAKKDGSWSVTLPARETGDYRAASGADVSETQRLLVSERHVLVKPTKTGLSVTVTPSAPYARFLVEEYIRERFGWWPIARGKTDYVSEAEVSLRRPALVRIVLVDIDGWTPLATSRAVRLSRR